MKKLGLILAIVILSLQGWAQGTFRYFNTLDDYQGKGFADTGFDILSFSDSAYVVAGTSQDSVNGAGEPYVYVRPFFMVIDENGTIIGKHDYGRPFEQLGAVDNDIFLRAPDGGYAIGGIWERWDSTTATGAFYGRYLLKLDSALDSVWIALDSGSMVINQVLGINKMIVSQNGDFIMCGNDNYNHLVLTKFDNAGNHIWNKTLPNYPMYVWTMQNLADGNFLIAGQRGYNCFLTECNFDGDVVWDSTFNNVNSTYQNCSMAKQLSNGGFFVYDFVPDNSGTSDMHCMWWDEAKHLYRELRIEMDYYQYARSIIELSDGSIILAGQTGTVDDPAIDKRAFVLKISPSGYLMWLRTYFYWYSGTSPMEDCLLAHDGGFIISGCSWDTTGTSPYPDTWILKVDSIGCPYPNCGPSLAVNPTETNEPHLIQAYPNPASDRIRLRCMSDGLHEKSVIRLLTLDGKVMDEVIMPMGFQEIGFDVSRFAAGVYFWEYRDEIGRREAAKFEVVR